MKHRKSPSTNALPDDRQAASGTRARITGFMSRAREKATAATTNVQVTMSSTSSEASIDAQEEHSDRLNYALLIILYTLQGIPMGLSASIPFLLQDKIQKLTVAAAAVPAAGAAVHAVASSSSAVAAEAARLSYSANAIFALCSWPFSLKLLWAPIVDAVFFRRFGRRKSWLVPVQALAGMIMVGGANFVEAQLGLGTSSQGAVIPSMNVKGVTAFFFVLYFLMATQDIAVDGWALTMLSKKNRGRGPVCNSIGQNIGYFLSFVGFLALNDPDSSETLWRPLLRMPSVPGVGLISLGTFIRSMGYFMLLTTTMVALFKREVPNPKQQPAAPSLLARLSSLNKEDDQDEELDAAELGVKETYHRLWAVCQLPAVRWLFLMLVTYRLPTALSDNVKFLKAVEFGMSKTTTALLSPTLILPIGILVPLIAAKVWHGHPLQQFTTAFKLRVTLVPLLDIFMLKMVRHKGDSSAERSWFWIAVIASTAAQAICNTLQFNSQMIFFASRVDPAIGGSYMTLLNTAANLGGTWPAAFVMWLIGKLTQNPVCHINSAGKEVCTGGSDPYFLLQLIFSGLGIAWIVLLGKKVRQIAALPDEAWRTHLLDSDTEDEGVVVNSKDVESGVVDLSRWIPKNETKQE